MLTLTLAAALTLGQVPSQLESPASPSQPVLRIFSMPDEQCKYCKHYEADAAQEPLRTLLKQFRPLKVLQGHPDCSYYGVQAYPTFLIDTGTGSCPIEKGYSRERFLNFLKRR